MDGFFFQEVVKAVQGGRRAVLATVIGTKGSVPRSVGSKLLYGEEGQIAGSVGGGAVEARTLQKCKEVLLTGKPQRLEVDITGTSEAEGICGGVVELFLEPLGASWRLIVVGAGHVGQALAGLAVLSGRFRVLLLDDRPLPQLVQHLPASEFLCCEDLEQALSEMTLTENDAVVIVTRCHAGDQEALSVALGKGAGYIGMIGSRQKVATIRKRLLDQGVEEKLLDEVFAPIGLDIGAQTPQELAVSILAEVLGVLTRSSMRSCARVRKEASS